MNSPRGFCLCAGFTAIVFCAAVAFAQHDDAHKHAAQPVTPVGPLPAGAVEIPNAAQPQLAAAADGRVWLVYGRSTEVFVACSDDGGKTFSAGVKVATVPKLMLGMRRGPRIAADGERLTVTVIAHELLAFTSTDGGKTWSAPVTINRVPGSAREGLHHSAGSRDGRTFVTWLDLRSSKMELYGAESADGGKTWGENQLVYRSPDQSICECCHPSARFDAEGNLAVMWRNSVGGNRDLWLARRTAGSSTFSPAKKQGNESWTLKACPMDGGDIVPLGDGGFQSLWMRAGEVFFVSGQGAAEQNLGKGGQPVAARIGGKTVVVFQKDGGLWLAAPAGSAASSQRVSTGRFPTMAALPGGDAAVLAYERGSAVVIERL